jgi:hypothetical protein
LSAGAIASLFAPLLVGALKRIVSGALRQKKE